MALPASATQAAIKDLRRSLVSADDDRISKVVFLVDSMVDRGAADGLLQPLRARLSHLQPRRPMRLSRLLFVPVDPIIVPASQWRRQTLHIPRTAMAPLAAEIRRRLGEQLRGFEARTKTLTTDQQERIFEIGQELWPRAAEILLQADAPPDWAEATGLSADDHRSIASALGILLRQANAIEAMAREARQGNEPDSADIRVCLAAAAEATAEARGVVGAQPVGMLLAILLARLPNAEQLITLAADLAAALGDPSARRAADQAIDLMLDGIEAGLDTGGRGGQHPDLAQAAVEQRQIAALLGALEGSGPASRPGRKQRAARLRQQADTAARARFRTDMASRVLAPAAMLSTEASDGDVVAIERTARDLHRFERASRALGGTDSYDRMLKEAAQALAASNAVISNRTDVARLVEIVQGPEAALAVLRGGPR